jgi:NitT/TauT family transport system substrate-binding protein
VAVGTWAGYGNVYVGIEKGYFKGLKVTASAMDDSNARHAAFASGSLDVMMSTVDQFALEADQRLPGSVLVVTDESWGSDGILGQPTIKTLADLRGKRIAYTPGLAGEYLLGRALERGGLSRKDVTAVPLNDPDAGITAFLNRQVDAVVSWEPHLSDVVAKGQGTLLASSRDIPETIVDILVAKETVTGDPEVLRAFLDGWFKAGEFMNTNPDEANAIIAKGLNLTADDVKGMRAGLKLSDRSRNVYFLRGGTASRFVSLFDSAVQYWASLGRITNSPRGAERIAPSVAEYFAQ